MHENVKLLNDTLVIDLIKDGESVVVQ